MRITLDTNQLVRALMRPPELAVFLMAWEAKRFTVIGSSELIDEYLAVLEYPELFPYIYPELRRRFSAQLLDQIELVKLPTIPKVCRDPDDDKVIATALFGMVDYLVTDDADLKSWRVREILYREGIQLLTIDQIIEILDRNIHDQPNSNPRNP